MPTTAAGTPFTTTRKTLPGHGEMCVTVADAHATATGLRCLWYFHGSAGPADQFVAVSAWNRMRDALLDDNTHPWVIVEGDGGEGYTGPRSWGNDASVAAYNAYLADAADDFDIGDVMLLGRSMGGLTSARILTADTGNTYAGWINNSGVSTAFVGTEDTEGDAASSASYFDPAFRAAWGASNLTTLRAAMEASDAIPEEWDASVWAGKNILNCYGTADPTVPWTTRGAGPLRTIWAGQPMIDSIAPKIGGDHSGPNGSYGQVAEMTAFIAEVFGDSAPIAVPFTEILSLTMVDSYGARQLITL